MGRYVQAKCKLCRRRGEKLFLKGARCWMDKCAFSRRPTPPGMHGVKTTSKPTYYGIQLREKQKVKRMYGMLERQFKRFFTVAAKSKGVTGRTLIQLLERRLDNIIFRALFTFSRNQARQVVSHGFVFVDGKRINIPSYVVGEGQSVEIKARDSVKQGLRDNIEKNSKERSSPTWINVDKDNLKIKVVRLPEKEDLTIAVDEQLIIELYSK